METAAGSTALYIKSYVFADDFCHPAVLIREAATLELLSERWVELGLGSGWAEGPSADEVEFNILIWHLLITEDRKQGVEQIAGAWGMTSEQVLGNVHILVGTVDQIVEDLQMRRARFGIAYSTVNAEYMDTLAPVVARLVGR